MDPIKASVRIDLAQQHPVSPHLYGAFFEEINHAGEGGLYAEMVRDRSFDAIAHAAKFSMTQNRQVDVTETLLNGNLSGVSGSARRIASHNASGVGSFSSSRVYKQLTASKPSWQPIGAATKLALTRQAPLGRGNPVAMVITSSACRECTAGIFNEGYWGIALRQHGAYHISLYLRALQPAGNGTAISEVSVLLQSGNGIRTYARVMFKGLSTDWKRFSAEFPTRNVEEDSGARLAVVFSGPGKVGVDIVSMMPSENVRRGTEGYPWPFREDLLQMLKALHPRFLRFPGGCYVEGQQLQGAFRWKGSVGPPEERPGHWNLWGYWSTDGLGLFEYMQLAEELGAAPVWVINSGISHQESVSPEHLGPWLQDALDSVEFVTGSEDTTWGTVRAIMGHPLPWQLPYLAIGNEDCGKPHYLANYKIFYSALKLAHPRLTLVSNCNMNDFAPQDLYDWHMYSSPSRMFEMRTTFDNVLRQERPDVFVSEYAVTTGGGHGNLIGALSEAAFMTGLEQNSDAVAMASYAPLLAHTNFRGWPTNLIVFDSSRAYGIVSYHVQQLFSLHQGITAANTTVDKSDIKKVIAASATCSTTSCDAIALKVVNVGERPVDVAVTTGGVSEGSFVAGAGDVTFLSGNNALLENSFEEPVKVAPVRSLMNGLGREFLLRMPPLSLTVVELRIEKMPTQTA